MKNRYHYVVVARLDNYLKNQQEYCVICDGNNLPFVDNFLNKDMRQSYFPNLVIWHNYGRVNNIVLS